MLGRPVRMESRATWRTCSIMAAVAAVLLILSLLGRDFDAETSQPAWEAPQELPKPHDHILLRSPQRCSANLQTMLRTLGATSDALYGRLLDIHADPASAIVVDVSVFTGGQCMAAAAKGFKRVICFESSPVNHEATKAAAKEQEISEDSLQLVNMAVLNVTGFEVEVLLGDGSDGSYSQMVPTTTLDDYLLPRMKLKRDDAFEAHMKDDAGHARVIGLSERKEELYLLRMEVQGFEGLVVEGMQELLRRKAVTYVLLTIWPKAMVQEGRKSCADTLRALSEHGYTLHELALNPAVWNGGANKPREQLEAEVHDHPTDIEGLCGWLMKHSSDGGLWVDVLAVHNPQLGGGACATESLRSQE